MPTASTLFLPYHSTPMHPCNIHLTAALYRTPPRTQFAVVQLRTSPGSFFLPNNAALQHAALCRAHSGVEPFPAFPSQHHAEVTSI